MGLFIVPLQNSLVDIFLHPSQILFTNSNSVHVHEPIQVSDSEPIVNSTEIAVMFINILFNINLQILIFYVHQFIMFIIFLLLLFIY